MDDEGGAQLVADNMRENMLRRGVTLSMFGKQPRSAMLGLHNEIQELATDAVSIPFIHQVLRLVGIDCSVISVRRYIEKEMPVLYATHYGRPKMIKEGGVDVSADSAHPEQATPRDDDVRLGSVATDGKNMTPRGEIRKYRGGSVFEEENRIRADPASYFGKEMVNQFDFLRPRPKKNI